MPQTQVEKYLKNLYKVYQYKQAAMQSGGPVAEIKFPNPTGTSLSAREIAMSVMNSPTPHKFKIDGVKAPDDDSHPILNLGREILNSGPVKTTLDIISRPAYGIGGVFEALSGTEEDDDTPEGAKSLGEVGRRVANIPGQFWEGFKGDDPTMVSDVMERNQDQSNLPRGVKFAEGLIADIASDPTTYIPVGGAITAGKKILGLGNKAGKVEKAAEEVVEATPTPASTPEGIPEAPAVPQVQAPAPGSLQEALQKVPTAAHPNLEIESPFKTVETVKPAPAPSPTLSVRRAIKAALLQSDDHVINGHKLGDLLRVAKENPDKQAGIDKLINQEVNRIFTSKEYGTLYKGKKASTALQFLNSRGAVVGGLNLKQLNQLFKEGKIGTGADDALEFPIHDPEDLDAFFLKNAKSETVSLRNYLEDLGVGIKAGDKEVIKAAPPKTVIETSHRAPSSAEAVAWLTNNGGKLSKKELQYLVKAGPKEFDTRVAELKAKTVIKSFGSVKEFEEA